MGDCDQICGFNSPDDLCSGHNWDNKDDPFGRCCPCKWDPPQVIAVFGYFLFLLLISFHRKYRWHCCFHLEWCKRKHWPTQKSDKHLDEMQFEEQKLDSFFKRDQTRQLGDIVIDEHVAGNDGKSKRIENQAGGGDMGGVSKRTSDYLSQSFGAISPDSQVDDADKIEMMTPMGISPDKFSEPRNSASIGAEEMENMMWDLKGAETPSKSSKGFETLKQPKISKIKRKSSKFSQLTISDETVQTLRYNSLTSHKLERRLSPLKALPSIFWIFLPILSIFFFQKPKQEQDSHETEEEDQFYKEQRKFREEQYDMRTPSSVSMRSRLSSKSKPKKSLFHTVDVDTRIGASGASQTPTPETSHNWFQKSRNESVVEFFLSEILGLHLDQIHKGRDKPWKKEHRNYYTFVFVLAAVLQQTMLVLSILLPMHVKYENYNYEISDTELYGPLTGYCIFAIYYLLYLAYSARTTPVNKKLLKKRSLNFTVRWQPPDNKEDIRDFYEYELQDFVNKVSNDAEWQDRESGTIPMCKKIVSSGFAFGTFFALCCASIPWCLRYYVNNQILSRGELWPWMTFSFVMNVFWIHRVLNFVSKIMRRLHKQLIIVKSVSELMIWQNGKVKLHVQDPEGLLGGEIKSQRPDNMLDVRFCQYHVDLGQTKQDNLVSWIIYRDYVHKSGKISAAQQEMWIAMLVAGTVAITCMVLISLIDGTGMRYERENDLHGWEKIQIFNQAGWIALAVACVLWFHIFTLLYIGRLYRNQQHRQSNFLVKQKFYMMFKRSSQSSKRSPGQREKEDKFFKLFESVIELVESQRLIPHFFSIPLDDGSIIGISILGSALTALITYLHQWSKD